MSKLLDQHGNVIDGVLPFGQTELADWAGGKAIVRITGAFATAGGVSTVVDFRHRVARADGVLVPSHHDGKRFYAPGTYELELEPGPYYFHCSGPSLNGRPVWGPIEIDVTRGMRPPKVETLEERMRKLETRADTPASVETVTHALH